MRRHRKKKLIVDQSWWLARWIPGWTVWVRALDRVLGQDTKLSHCLSPPRSINGYDKTLGVSLPYWTIIPPQGEYTMQEVVKTVYFRHFNSFLAKRSGESREARASIHSRIQSSLTPKNTYLVTVWVRVWSGGLPEYKTVHRKTNHNILRERCYLCPNYTIRHVDKAWGRGRGGNHKTRLYPTKTLFADTT